MQMRTTFLTLCALAVWIFPATSTLAKPLTIEAKPVKSFLPGSVATKFGKLEFLGGLELTGNHEEFGGFSGMRFRDDGTLVLLTDKARVVTTRLIRENGKPIALEDARITRIKAANGRTITGAQDKDAEALEISGNSYFVGYERNDRVLRMSMRNRTLIANGNYAVDFLPQGFPNNKGPEAIALHPVTGKLYVFAEYALDEQGNHKGYLVSGGRIERQLSVKLRDSFSLTDAAFLPNGDLLLLERYFNPILGVYLRMRKIPAASLEGNSPLDGEILIDVNGSHQIDNMEGLALSNLPDGTTRVTLISDDNFSGRQRTLLLEFRLMN